MVSVSTTPTTSAPTASDSLIDHALAWLLSIEEHDRIVHQGMTRDPEELARARAVRDNLYRRFLAVRGIEVGDVVDVLHGLPRDAGRPRAKVIRVNAVTLSVEFRGTKTLVKPDSVRLGWSEAVDAARAIVAVAFPSEPELEDAELELSFAETFGRTDDGVEEISEPTTAEVLADEEPELPVVIIPCGGRKLETPAPAAELYVGSYFRAALAAARAVTTDDRIRILSGLHGFVWLRTVLDPYEQRIDAPGAVTVSELEAQVAEDELLARVRAGELKAHVFAGKAYAERVAAALGSSAELPLSLAVARGIGDHLAYFRQIAGSDDPDTKDNDVTDNRSTLITCVRCGRTTTDPDRWDPEADTGRVFCDACWPHREAFADRIADEAGK